MKTRTKEQVDSALKQIELLSQALAAASANGGYFLNAKCKQYPRILGESTYPSAYNALVLAADSDRQGHESNAYLGWGAIGRLGGKMLPGYQTPALYNYYSWGVYCNRNNNAEKIGKAKYDALSDKEKQLWNKVRQKDYRKLYNFAQTTLSKANSKLSAEVKEKDEGRQMAPGSHQERALRHRVNEMTRSWSENLSHVGRSSTGTPYYDNAKDAIMLAKAGSYENYFDYVQDVMRTGAAATAALERLARSGMEAPHGKTEVRTRNEKMVAELASAVRMLELGLPARLDPECQKFAESWCDELRCNLDLLDAFESDLNKCVDMMRQAEQGQKIAQTTDLNQRREEKMWKEQLPQLDSADALSMKSVILHGGLDSSAQLFASPSHRAEVLSKTGSEELALRAETAMEMYRSTPAADTAVKELRYKEALEAGAQLCERFEKLLAANDLRQKGSTTIADAIAKQSDSRTKKFVVVLDQETGMADVVLPRAARSGGEVVGPGGSRRQYWLEPSEAIPTFQNRAEGFNAIPYQVKAMSKRYIRQSLLRSHQATRVRFFETKEGHGKYNPTDDYFVGKKVYVAVVDKSQNVSQRVIMDVSEAAQSARHPQFEAITMMPSEQGTLNLLYLEAKDAEPVAVVVSREDQNTYWTAHKLMKDNVESMRQRGTESMKVLTRKIYAEAKANPSIRYDKLLSADKEVPMDKVRRTNIYRDNDKYYISAIIDQNGNSRTIEKEITKAQFNRVMWCHGHIAQARQAMASYVLGAEIKEAIGARASNTLATNLAKETLERAREYMADANPTIPIIRAGEYCYALTDAETLELSTGSISNESLDIAGERVRGFRIPFKQAAEAIEILGEESDTVLLLAAPMSPSQGHLQEEHGRSAAPAVEEEKEIVVSAAADEVSEIEEQQSRPHGLRW